MKNEILFALDIGTRTVVGIIAEKISEDEFKVLDIEIREHPARSMMGGQIHHIPKVANTVKSIKTALEERSGQTLNKVAVAAAGRALLTNRGEAEMNFLYPQEVEKELYHAIVLDAVRDAQHSTVTESSNEKLDYHCVGYSIIRESLDNVPIGSLIGQIGSHFKIEIIATFLPRMVIDSLYSALKLAGLEIKYITLEPIAAMNLVIPENARQLNVALIDIGAGTADIAISDKGTIQSYAMLPFAGDQITDALCQKYLLDFSVGEDVKKQITHLQQEIKFKDITGTTYTYSREKILSSIDKNIKLLAHDIGKKILEVNGKVPQVVICIGGGSLTPNLQQEIAKELNLPKNRVVLADTEITNQITSKTEALKPSQAVTPLAIVADALLHQILELHTVYVNKQPVRLFALNNATVGDALIGAGITPSQYFGKIGAALSFELNGEIAFVKGTLGKPGKIEVNGEEGNLTTLISSGSNISFTAGVAGTKGEGKLRDVLPKKYVNEFITINNQKLSLINTIKVNGQPITDLNLPLKDGDKVNFTVLETIGEVLEKEGFSNIHVGNATEIILNDLPIRNLQQEIKPGDRIQITDRNNVTGKDTSKYEEIKIKLNNNTIQIPRLNKKTPVILTDVFNVIDFKPEEGRGRRLLMTVNDKPANFMTKLKEGDIVELKWEETK